MFLSNANTIKKNQFFDTTCKPDAEDRAVDTELDATSSRFHSPAIYVMYSTMSKTKAEPMSFENRKQRC